MREPLDSERRRLFSQLLGVVVCVCGWWMTSGIHAEEFPHLRASWSDLQPFLLQGVQNGVYPGAVAAVANEHELLFQGAVGHFTYGEPDPVSHTNPEMRLDTLFDMASVTKVLATTTATAQFVQRGELGLDWLISDERLLGAGFANHGKDSITVRNCLLHNAGFPPDPNPNYWFPEFGCPATTFYHPPLTFTCQNRIYSAFLQQTLMNPVGSVYVYSDLSMITMMYVIGKRARELGYIHPSDLYPGCDQGGLGAYECYYEAYVRKFILEDFGMSSSSFLPDMNKWSRCAPAWNDTTYRHRVVQGQVSDGNSYALGGISGHAGLFSTISDVVRAARLWLYPVSDNQGPADKNGVTFLTKKTVDTFTRIYNVSQSSRALGWDTNDYTMNTLRTCGNLSSTTFLHLGYTGTQICCDPARRILTVLLTNRVYPSVDNVKIEIFRRQYNNLVKAIYDQKDRQSQSDKVSHPSSKRFRMRGLVHN